MKLKINTIVHFNGRKAKILEVNVDNKSGYLQMEEENISLVTKRKTSSRIYFHISELESIKS